MKKPFVIVYTIIISLALVFAIGLFGYNIYTDYEKGTVAADNRFERMSLSIKGIPESVKFNTTAFDNSIMKAINGIDNYSSLLIEINDQPYITYPTSNDIQTGSSKLVINKYKKFDLHGNQISINANLYVLTPSVINHDVKISFAIILFTTVLTLFMIMLDVLIGNPSNSKKETVEEKTDNSDLDIYVEPETDDSEVILEEPNNPVETESEPVLEPEVADVSVEVVSDPLFDNVSTSIIIPKFEADGTELKVTSIPEEPSEEEKIAAEIENSEINQYKSQLENDEVLPLPSDDIKPMNMDSNSNSPEGLFSPLTGFGWESYLNTRLDNELNRATASEIDLAVFIIKITDISRESDITKRICAYLTTQFQFKDLIFEYKNDSYVALKIGTSIDDAIAFANKILLDIDTILNGAGKCYIGISTRSVRMVSAERIINEAEQALNHAQEETDSPIIAFRVDADKYRKYLESRS